MPFCCNQTILQKMNVFWAPTIVVLFISICDMGNSIFPQIFLFEPPAETSTQEHTVQEAFRRTPETNQEVAVIGK